MPVQPVGQIAGLAGIEQIGAATDEFAANEDLRNRTPAGSHLKRLSQFTATIARGIVSRIQGNRFVVDAVALQHFACRPAEFAEMLKALRLLQDQKLRRPGGDREMVDILALVLHHDEQAVLASFELALEGGVPTKTHVLNLLHRLIDGKTIDNPPLDTPQALILKHEPKANVERYDGLRAQIAGGRLAS